MVATERLNRDEPTLLASRAADGRDDGVPSAQRPTLGVLHHPQSDEDDVDRPPDLFRVPSEVCGSRYRRFARSELSTLDVSFSEALKDP